MLYALWLFEYGCNQHVTRQPHTLNPSLPHWWGCRVHVLNPLLLHLSSVLTRNYLLKPELSLQTTLHLSDCPT